MAVPTEPLPWRRDPVVLGAALLAAVAHACVFFAGEYLPYIDWPIHVGLISVFAHGDESGSLAYLRRSWAPNPYSLYYWVSALLAQVLPVVTAAKLALVLASAGLTLTTADFLEQHGRDPRLAVIAPMATFGYALGYGFVSFTFTMPFLLWALAELERGLKRASDPSASPRDLVRPALRLAAVLALTYLGHALVFLGTAFVVAVRVLGYVALARPFGRGSLRGVGVVVGGFTPAALLGLVRVTTLALGPARVTETTPGVTSGPWLRFPAFEDRWSGLRWYLLDRGPEPHLEAMKMVAGVFALVALLGLFRRVRRPRLPLGYALAMLGVVALYGLGPDGIERPFNVWLFYSRFATLAALVVFTAPTTRLAGAPGLALVGLMLGALGYDASLQRRHVVRISETAAGYAEVRALVPKRARILALSYGLEAADPMGAHPVLQTLYFHHLADGAAYTNYLFDHPLIPVQFRDDVARPRQPFWRTPDDFDPSTHGVDYDLLILRGAPVEPARRSPHHRLLAERHGWYVFETMNPPPWPDPAPRAR